jgi:predicted thioredoxin/glutaredoxin
MHPDLFNHIITKLLPDYESEKNLFIQPRYTSTYNTKIATFLTPSGSNFYFLRPLENETTISNVRIVGNDGQCFVDVGENNCYVLLAVFKEGKWVLDRSLASADIEDIISKI